MAKSPSSATAKPKAAAKPKPKAAPKAAPKAKAEPVAEPATGVAKAKFTKALDEARAGAQALATQAQDKAGAYRAQVVDKSEAWIEDAKVLSGQAKDKAADLAREGKTRASEAISGLGQIVAETAPAIDEKLGAKYGDYARTAARSIQESAAKLDAKDIGEIGEDAREFVKKSPGLAVGLAAVVGFFIARLFRGGSKSDAE